MKKTIGILGGMGPLATADLYRKIIEQTDADCDNDHIRVYIDGNSAIPDRTAAILHGGEDPVPEMLSALRHLEACGADCIIMPCNTAHFFLPRLQAQTDLPILDMQKITARVCRERFPGKTPAILATDGTIQSGLFDRALEEEGISWMHPDKSEQKTLMHLIYDVVKASKPMEPVKESWEQILDALRARGADLFILGCTELPVLSGALHSTGPFIDPTEELAREAIRFCGYQLKSPSC
ncbi:MAG: amino acid racemase [Oscillospiraceae bacterium]|nr:amino acid racemase [Oscillospiraceae bacterium]